MAEIGTATVKVLPDLEQFQQVIDSIPATGLTIREEITYEYEPAYEDRVIRTVKTTSVVKA